MSKEPTSMLPLARVLLKAWQEARTGDNNPARGTRSTCWLEHGLQEQTDLADSDRCQLRWLVEQGWTLRSRWPRSSEASVQRWIGERFYWSHARNFAHALPSATMVSSRLGRQGRKQPHWPRLLDAALRRLHRQQARLLVVPKTTLFDAVTAFAAKAQLETVSLELAQDVELEIWLARCLRAARESPGDRQHRICVSTEVLPNLQTEEEVAAGSKGGPLQDRAAMALADTIYVLFVRSKGHIERLLTERLNDDQYPTATVFLNVFSPEERTRAVIERLLDGGAVGWFVPQPEWSGPLRSARCRNEDDGSVKIQQICAHLPERWSLDQSAGDAIPHPPPRSEVADPKRKGPRQFLAHCTRGNSGPLPEEGEHVYQDRVWIEGRVRECHPLVTLNRICQQRRLRGTSRITRTTQRSVSFSAVPLPRLLRSRNFQSHLQRWDWEPYGLLIDRDALEGLGARPVIYGDEIDYARLPAAQKPYFQPLGKEPQQWVQEREWRLLGDLDLSVLPGDAVRLFVRTRIEALHMARIFSWPVLWIQ